MDESLFRLQTFTRFLGEAISEVQHPIRAVSRPEAVFLNY
jgi:hypothetical protein